MASIKKVTDSAVGNLCRHMDRSLSNNSNEDIDPEKSYLNENLLEKFLPGRTLTDREYYKELRNSCYVFNRDDVKTVGSWIITMPDIPGKTPAEIEALEPLFYRSCFDFLTDRYGVKGVEGLEKTDNIISCWVHRDEAGERSHMHFLFCPVVPDAKHDQGRKICMNDIVSLGDFKSFHPDLQRHLDAITEPFGFSFPVHTGITSAVGGNRSVKELKRNSAYEEKLRQANEEIERLKEANRKSRESGFRFGDSDRDGFSFNR